MLDRERPAQIAIIDYGMGNLFSVRQACAQAGLQGTITTSKADVMQADAVILPGVGAFGDAMQMLRRLDLISPLRDVAASGRPLVGICLGMQLLMSESEEFGRHEGLGLIPGDVVRLAPSTAGARALKVPQIGWNRLEAAARVVWTGTLLEGVATGTFMYFVHSFYVRPADASVVLALTRYGATTFCSALQWGSIVAFQCHPERSGRHGLQVYRNLAQRLHGSSLEARHA